jgi:hypothetical protein
MATTTNYGWTTPNDTDLVKDGAAAIRTLGSSIDTTVFANAGAGIAKTIVDAKGDIIAATAADTVARLAVGANDTVLTADSSTATGLKWAAPAGSGQNFSLINTGGTSMSGSTTVTVSGISGMNELFITAVDWSGAAQNLALLRLNSDSTSKYYFSGNMITPSSSYNASNYARNDSGAPNAISYYNIGQISNNASSLGSFGIRISGCNSAGIKMLSHVAGASAAGGVNHQTINGQGMYSGTSTISSISITNGSDVNFDGGTLYVYGSA